MSLFDTTQRSARRITHRASNQTHLGERQTRASLFTSIVSWWFMWSWVIIMNEKNRERENFVVFGPCLFHLYFSLLHFSLILTLFYSYSSEPFFFSVSGHWILTTCILFAFRCIISVFVVVVVVVSLLRFSALALFCSCLLSNWIVCCCCFYSFFSLYY